MKSHSYYFCLKLGVFQKRLLVKKVKQQFIFFLRKYM